ncbi:MAG TPA: polyhydroxyalkanoic acid system family protein [Gemmataceae bacterium]|nr:polyhydroxyalkanoic acid system family protein [Gemmataceae bacterium]
MRDLTATIPHNLGRIEARRRIDEELAMLCQQHAVFSELYTKWVQDTLHFEATTFGQSISGTLSVDDHAAHLALVLPWLAALMGGRIRQEIEGKLRLALSGPS